MTYSLNAATAYRKKAEGSLAEGFYRSRIRMPDRVSDAAASPSARSHLMRSLMIFHNNCQLGWLIDPDDRSILAFLPNQQPQFCEGSDVLPVPEMIPLNITAEQVFSWLRMQQ